MTRWIHFVLAFVAIALISPPGLAHAQVVRTPATAPILGATIRGSSATTFSISTSGTVTRTSGNAIRLSSASVTTPTISLNCGVLNLSGLCALRYMRVTITPVSGGQAAITKFRIANLSGATYRTGSAPAEAASLMFDLNPLGLTATASFTLAMDMTLAANAPSGAYTFDYVVTIQLV
ncbi:hypothetical protein [Brevundimonas sp.]|jgi:hypothetical protein|uniref:hypothetical protein n=1 Tax=Brevundimonas sp. TaxID=1871086 RepID=UPI0037C17170